METKTESEPGGKELDVPSGIMNMGNTCYLNTLLQCMIHCKPLRTFFIDFYEKYELTRGTLCPLLTEFGLLFHQLWNQKQSLMPKRFLMILNRISPEYLRFGQQHDMSEMWCWMLDTLQREYTVLLEQEHLQIQTQNQDGDGRLEGSLWTLEKMRSYAQFDTIQREEHIYSFHQHCLQTWQQFHKKDSFEWTLRHEGLFVQQIICNKCKKVYHNYEPFTCLTLEIPETTMEKQVTNLAECFQSYLKTDVLNASSEEQNWKCDDCHAYTPAEKIIRFWKVPDALVILLKRFSYTEDGHMMKRTTMVDIPLEFEFLMGTELLPMNSKKYRLSAIGNHYGGISGGHYDAICSHGEQWWKIDDLHMEPVVVGAGEGVATIDGEGGMWRMNRDAYMLFYERCNTYGKD